MILIQLKNLAPMFLLVLRQIMAMSFLVGLGMQLSMIGFHLSQLF